MVDNAFLYRFFPDEPCSTEAFHKDIARMLPNSGRMLNLGCGNNSSLAGFRTPQREVWGADLHEHPQLCHPEWFRLLDPGLAIPFPAGTIDLVVCEWVLEHVVTPTGFLQEVQRVLRPGGWLAAHTISAQHYVTWVRRILDILPHAAVQKLVYRLYGREEHDTFPTYYRLNTVPQLQRCGRRAGLRLETVRRYSNLGEYFAFSPRLRRLAVLADWLLESCSPGWGRIYFTAFLQKRAVAQAPARRAA
jgi:SAM-dependent methyltransferase